MRPFRPLCLAALSLGLASCSLWPDYVRPTVLVPTVFKEAGEWKPAAAAETVGNEKWWTAFGDPILDGLEERVSINNQNLKAAEAQYRAARATLDGARSSLFPSLSLSTSANRGANNSTANPAATVNTTYAVSGGISWEIDVWGRLRKNVESADAKLLASGADLAAARLSAQALLAQTYGQFRASAVQRGLLQRTVASYRRFLELTNHRLAPGIAYPLDVAQAETQLGNAEAQAIDIENQHAQLEHAIAVLVGESPSTFSVPASDRLPQIPAMPALLPSALLENRPDIAAAERRMAAANAQIGVAGAAYFPVLNLTGTSGYRGSVFSNLLSAPNHFWSIGPALAMTLLDGGARSAAVSQATASYDQSVASYRQTVLTVFQEVEDNLAATRLLALESEAQARAVAAARRSREIAENQYKAGTSSALTVVTAQAAELSAEISAINLYSRRLQATVQLFKNTGGHWSAPTP